MSWNSFTNAGSLKTSAQSLSAMPAGVIMAYAGTTAPLGFLFCDGTAVSRTGYASLYTAISGTFGIGDGSTTFNLPDLRGRTIIGLGTNAAVNALALSDGVAVANRRPQHRHTPHTHSGATFAVQQIGASGGTGYYLGTAGTIGTTDGGSGTATDSLDAPAFLVTNYIISTTTVAPVVASNVTAYGGSVASGSSIVVTGNSTYLLTGTTALSTITGGVTGNSLTILASGQATGVCVVLNNGTTANALNLRDSANFGIYAGESVTFMYNGTYWVETSRNVKTVLDYVQITSLVNITGTTSASPTTAITGNAITYDGSTPMLFEFFSPSVAIGTNNINIGLYEDGSVLSNIGVINTTYYIPWTASHRRTPTASSHTASIRAWVNAGTGSIQGGSGTSAAAAPAYIKISRSI